MLPYWELMYIEMNLRLSRLGKRILFVPDSVVHHEQHENYKSWLRKCFKYGVAQTSFLYLHPRYVFNIRLLAIPAFAAMLLFPQLLLFAVALISIELLLQKRPKELFRFSGFLISTWTFYFLGQLRGLAWPALQRPDEKKVLANTSNL